MTNAPRKVLISGSHGLVGAALMEFLSAKDVAVVRLVRVVCH